MKELRKIETALNKVLNDIHSVELFDGTSGMIVDWEIRIAVVATNRKGRRFATTAGIKKVVRAPKKASKR